MNGNDYLEIAEEHQQQIFEDYIEWLHEGNDIPEWFVDQWVSNYLQGGE